MWAFFTLRLFVFSIFLRMGFANFKGMTLFRPGKKVTLRKSEQELAIPPRSHRWRDDPRNFPNVIHIVSYEVAYEITCSFFYGFSIYFGRGVVLVED